MVKQTKDKISEKLGIDDKDKIILSELSENPLISQNILSEKTNLSQPAVGMRILKMKQKGVLAQTVGINFKKVEMIVGKVDCTAKDPYKIVKEFECCPYFLNALIMSGENNLCLFFMAPDLKILETIVNQHLRSNDKISNVQLNIMINSSRDFIFSVNLDDSKFCKSKFCRDDDLEIIGEYNHKLIENN